MATEISSMVDLHGLGFFNGVPLAFKDSKLDLNEFSRKMPQYFRRKKKNAVYDKILNGKTASKNSTLFDVMNIHNYKSILKGQILSEEQGILDTLLTKFKSSYAQKKIKSKPIPRGTRPPLKFLKFPERKLPVIDFKNRSNSVSNFNEFPSEYNYDTCFLNEKFLNIVQRANDRTANAIAVDKQIKKNFSQADIYQKTKVKLGMEKEQKLIINESKSQEYLNILKEEKRKQMEKNLKLLQKRMKRSPKNENSSQNSQLMEINNSILTKQLESKLNLSKNDN